MPKEKSTHAVSARRDGDFSGQGLTALPPEITNLTQLRILNLTGNQLTTLPPEITNLTQLQYLDLAGNQLTTLPPEITNLTQLHTLYLTGNQLTTLPPEMADLVGRGLRLIGLESNPGLSELAGLDTADLVAYLRSLADAVPLYEAKVLLVGEGEVGKTSLINSLLGKKFVTNLSSTHGIEVHQLVGRHPTTDQEITLRAWDFGGQDVYRITHQFFFSSRALYILVWNARKSQQ